VHSTTSGNSRRVELKTCHCAIRVLAVNAGIHNDPITFENHISGVHDAKIPLCVKSSGKGDPPAEDRPPIWQRDVTAVASPVGKSWCAFETARVLLHTDPP